MTWLFRSLAAAVALAAVGVVATAANAADKVTIGTVSAISDAGMFVADAKGYFAKEGIAAEFIAFDSGAKMIPPLGSGEIDVGAGSVSPGLYNATARGIAIKMVADKAGNIPGHAFQVLMVRKALIDDGSVKSLKDLKGRKVAISAAASADISTFNQAMKSAGLGFDDVEKVYMGFPQHIAAYQNGAIDASITTEPTVSAIVKLGTAVRFKGNDEFYPGAQIGAVLYSSDFGSKRPEVAKRFLVAYLKGVRDFNAAVNDGKIAGPGADEIINILVKYSNVKNPEVLKAINAHWCDPNGELRLKSLETDWAFFKERGLLDGKVTVDQVVDRSFLDAALKEIGTVKP